MAPPPKKCVCPEGVPLWVFTFGDCMSLLLTFFVLLVSLSSIEESVDVREALGAIQQHLLGVLPQNTGVVSVLPVQGTGRLTRSRLMRLAQKIRERLQVIGRESEVRLKVEKEGLRITLSSQILFDPASADVRPEAIPVLRDVAQMLSSEVAEATIQARGFTDDRPLTSSRLYNDNYDLSYARAKAIALQIVDLSRDPGPGLSLENFEIMAMGPASPVASNETADGRAMNRRVELFVTTAVADDLPELQELDEFTDRSRFGATTPGETTGAPATETDPQPGTEEQ